MKSKAKALASAQLWPIWALFFFLQSSCLSCLFLPNGLKAVRKS